MAWEPITIEQLRIQIHEGERELDGELLNIWKSIQMDPVKWKEKKFGEEGGGFWVIAIFGAKVIWYNDIEEGFNISQYSVYGEIDKYACEEDRLSWVLFKLFKTV